MQGETMKFKQYSVSSVTQTGSVANVTQTGFVANITQQQELP
jgi:hypothetical protein